MDSNRISLKNEEDFKEFCLFSLIAAEQGFEPQYRHSECRVLPLDDSAIPFSLQVVIYSQLFPSPLLRSPLFPCQASGLLRFVQSIPQGEEKKEYVYFTKNEGKKLI